MSIARRAAFRDLDALRKGDAYEAHFNSRTAPAKCGPWILFSVSNPVFSRVSLVFSECVESSLN